MFLKAPTILKIKEKPFNPFFFVGKERIKEAFIKTSEDNLSFTIPIKNSHNQKPK